MVHAGKMRKLELLDVAESPKGLGCWNNNVKERHTAERYVATKELLPVVHSCELSLG